MILNRKIKSFVFWVILLNWPPVLGWVLSVSAELPFINGFLFVFALICFFPYFFWINIPASFIGESSYFVYREFGAMPQTPLAWIFLAGFWTLIAIVLALLTSYYPGHKKQKQQEGENI